MQLEELQQQWRELGQKLDQALALETEVARRVVIQPARRRINRWAIWPTIDLVGCVAVLLLNGASLGGHWQDWRLVVPAGAVMIGAIAILVSSVDQLRCVAELDWGGSVAEIQGSLDRLRVAKIRQFKWIILLSPLVGFCGFLVGLEWVLEWLSEGRFNVFDKLDSSWIAANYAFGVLFVPLGYFVARFLAKRGRGQGWRQAALDDIAGKSLKAAARDVATWASLRQESTQTESVLAAQRRSGIFRGENP